MKKLLFAVMIVLFLAACSNQQGAPANDMNNQRNNVSKVANPPQHDRSLSNPDIIPSETGEKIRTTDRDGETYPGVGKNIYSSIGTSGIHEGGVSSYFESILKGEGIDGVSVFVVDDAVILARDKAENTNHSYDNMQKQLLSGNEGESGKGQAKGVKPDNQQNADNHDNLQEAKQKMHEMFDGHVTILTVTQQGANDLIKGIKKSVENKQYSQASQQLLKLLDMTE